jgi:hypothetical protein
MNFVEASKYFRQDGIYVITDSEIRTNVGYNQLYLRNYYILLIDGANIVNIGHLSSGYTRTNVFILEKDAKDLGELDKMRMVKGKCEINGKLIDKLRIRTLDIFTVNQQKFTLVKPQLAIEGNKESGENPLIMQFITFINSITDKSVGPELMGINIDMPEYGIIDGRLFIINKDDPFINRMMIFERCNIINKQCNVLSMYIFGQDLQSMQSHILNKYVMIVDGIMKINVDLDESLKVTPNNDTIIEMPLDRSRFRDHNIRDAVKLFSRKYEYGKIGNAKK